MDAAGKWVRLRVSIEPSSLNQGHFVSITEHAAVMGSLKAQPVQCNKATTIGGGGIKVA